MLLKLLKECLNDSSARVSKMNTGRVFVVLHKKNFFFVVVVLFFFFFFGSKRVCRGKWIAPYPELEASSCFHPFASPPDCRLRNHLINYNTHPIFFENGPHV